METPNCLKILIASDCHLGYMEKHGQRGNDSFNTFEEILLMAKLHEVDFILLGGDLFHENKPSLNSRIKCMQLLRKHCLGNRPVEVEFLSDPSENFSHYCSEPIVNYEDPNINVSIPIFSIHGNHDDPCGIGQFSVLDEFSTAGVLNFFGKWTNLKEIIISPILLRKGTTKLALYGLGAMKDERLFRLFRERKVKMLLPKNNMETWFNLFVLHQNRNKRGASNYIPDKFFDDFLDLVIWGHEHECRITPEWSESKKFFISQPGSSIVTSLCCGEAKPKKVGILNICGKKFKIEEILLETCRPFIYEEVILSQSDINFDVLKPSLLVEDFAKNCINEMLLKAQSMMTGNKKQPLLPILRLKINYMYEDQLFNVTRFNQKFANQLANPEDAILFRKERKNVKSIDVSFTENLMNNIDDEELTSGNEITVENFIEKYFLNLSEDQQLQLLSERGMGEAILRFVNKDDCDSVFKVVRHQLHYISEYIGEKQIDNEQDILNELMKFRLQRKKFEKEELEKILDDQLLTEEKILNSPLKEENQNRNDFTVVGKSMLYSQKRQNKKNSRQQQNNDPLQKFFCKIK